MHIHELENEYMAIRVSPMGAELQSLYSKVFEREYLWQPGYETWPHHSMLLFPNPGRIAHNRIIIGGKVFPATMHGFAHKSVFDVVKADETEIILELAASDETRRVFPYEFRFQVCFSVERELVIQMLRVINADNQPIYCCLGAHPGFYCPITLDESGDDYELVFDRPQYIDEMELQENTRLLTGRRKPMLKGTARMPLSDHFFDGGPRLLDGVDANTVTMRSKKSGHFVEIGIEGFESMCLWGVGTMMSILCIEPWCGTSDRVDTDHVWENKPGIQKIEVGDIFERKLTFRVG
ncbi:MAG: aldose 1-epimerase family protein [Christensenellales bacterium]|jgi:galactose mutarotase-like enzyme